MHQHTSCGQCGGLDLYRIPQTPGGQSRIVLGERLMQSVEISQYVCTDCGHIEEWVNNREDLNRLKAALAASRLRIIEVDRPARGPAVIAGGGSTPNAYTAGGTGYLRPPVPTFPRMRSDTDR